MGTLEDFLQIEYFGIDMMGIVICIFLVIFISICYFITTTPIWVKLRGPSMCFGFSVPLFVLAFTAYDRQAEAVNILSEWIKTDGIVAKVEQLEIGARNGQMRYKDIATVQFIDRNGMHSEGDLLHEHYDIGSEVIIYYDPERDYLLGSTAHTGTRELYSIQGVKKAAGLGTVAACVMSFLFGTGLCAFSIFKVFGIIRGRSDGLCRAPSISARL